MSKWHFCVINDALKQRFLLQDVGLEIFATDGNNSLFVFESSSDRDLFLSQLVLQCQNLNSPGSFYRISRDTRMEKVRVNRCVRWKNLSDPFRS